MPTQRGTPNARVADGGQALAPRCVALVLNREQGNGGASKAR
jgi:hypothetical protein